MEVGRSARPALAPCRERSRSDPGPTLNDRQYRLHDQYQDSESDCHHDHRPAHHLPFSFSSLSAGLDFDASYSCFGFLPSLASDLLRRLLGGRGQSVTRGMPSVARRMVRIASMTAGYLEAPRAWSCPSKPSSAPNAHLSPASADPCPVFRAPMMITPGLHIK